MNREMLMLVDAISREKNVERDVVFGAVEAALAQAECAETAIATLERNPTIRVVITDVHMPGSMDGVRLAHFIRDRWPPTGLIVASGAAELSAADLPSDTTFLRKPFDFGVLSAEIARWCPAA